MVSQSADPGPLYHYVVVRADLPHPVQVVQAVHAAGESSQGNLPQDTRAVILTVPDERALMGLALRLSASCIQFCLIQEPDAPFDGAAMSLGVVPQPRTKKLKAAMGRLPLLE